MRIARQGRDLPPAHRVITAAACRTAPSCTTALPSLSVGFIPYAGEGFAVLIPSKWNPSREQDFPGVVLRCVSWLRRWHAAFPRGMRAVPAGPRMRCLAHSWQHRISISTHFRFNRSVRKHTLAVVALTLARLALSHPCYYCLGAATRTTAMP